MYLIDTVEQAYLGPTKSGVCLGRFGGNLSQEYKFLRVIQISYKIVVDQYGRQTNIYLSSA